MRFLSYGEDALTLAAVTQGLPGFLNQLDDPTDPAGAVVFYRPSFGRRSGVPGRPRSEFGEFDAIIATPQGTYLVEAKWSSSSELQDGVLTLREVQLRRHRLLRTYIELWRRLQPRSWSSFTNSAAAQELTSEPGLSLPRSATTLARNLEFILRQLETSGPVRDVLLLSVPETTTAEIKIGPQGFEIVTFRSKSAGGAGFLELELSLEAT